MVSASDHVRYQGILMDRLTYERLRALNRLVRSTKWGSEKSDITLIQGIGGAAASGGTHVSGGCWDITPFNWKYRVLGGRLLGGMDWYRPTLPNVWSAHIHGVTAGAGYAALAARRQVTAGYAGRNGLANNGKDTGPRLIKWPLFIAPWSAKGKTGVYYAKKAMTMYDQPTVASKSLGTLPKGGKFTVIAMVNVDGVVKAMNSDGKFVSKSGLSLSKPVSPKPPTPKKKIESLRIGHLNTPAPGVGSGSDLGNDAARLKRVAQLVQSKSLAIVSFNELGAREGANVPSAYADMLMDYLGSAFTLTVPKLSFNENYLVTRNSEIEPGTQPVDLVVREGYEGKHVTHRELLVKQADKPIHMGTTHLVADRKGAAVQGPVAARLFRSAADGNLAVLAGDMNTTIPFATTGLNDARKTAVKSTNKDMATYRKWGEPKPDSNPDWIIDQFKVDNRLKTNGYTVEPDVDAAGKFRDPRVGDHLLTLISVTEI